MLRYSGSKHALGERTLPLLYICSYEFHLCEVFRSASLTEDSTLLYFRIRMSLNTAILRCAGELAP
jgi:hypothetical protein